jgi:hypothetical protein
MCEFVSRLVPIPHARAGGAGRSAKTPTRSLEEPAAHQDHRTAALGGLSKPGSE